jgi:Cu(I)/Ag(I) efflux system membrane fusion protein
VFDARAVVLGPRAGAWYPLLQGLSKGDLIVSRGSFLIDAETRLNPKAAEGATSATLASPAAAPPDAGHIHGK